MVAVDDVSGDDENIRTSSKRWRLEKPRRLRNDMDELSKFGSCRQLCNVESGQHKSTMALLSGSLHLGKAGLTLTYQKFGLILMVYQ
jgi:hypothetical protein